MFDFDVSKLLVVGVIALIVIGPKELPGMLRTVGQFVGKARRITSDLKKQFADAMDELDPSAVTKEIAAIRDSANNDIFRNPATAMRGHLTTGLEDSSKNASAVAAATVAAEPAYASPEMKEYLAPSPEAPAGARAALKTADESGPHQKVA